jgi:predicted nucleic-acid-binding protein
MPSAVATSDWQSWFGYADCDFSDVIIAHLNRENGCSTTLTFDRHAARRVSGMELLS